MFLNEMKFSRWDVLEFIGHFFARPIGLAARFPEFSPVAVLRATGPSRHFLGG
jgi:hypothetical protein